jgi:hypothetical protein
MCAGRFSPKDAQHGHREWWVYLWVLPISLVGLFLGVVALRLGATSQWHNGVLEIASPSPDSRKRRGRWLRRVPFVAITLGHVVLGRDHGTLAHWRAHEHTHVRQMERWGPFFPFAYAASSLFAWAIGRHPYWDNAFERQARHRAHPQ